MAKDLLLYDFIYNDTAAAFIQALDSSKGDIKLRVNSGGGSVFAGWGMIAKMQEVRQAGRKINIQIDGQAASFAANLPLFADHTTAWNISQFTLHRAAGYVSSETDQQRLDSINKDLRAVMELKVKKDKLLQLKGVTMNQIFDPTQRIDVNLTAQEALQIGLIDEVKDITTADIKAQAEAYEVFMMSKAGIDSAYAQTKISETQTIQTMTVQELKDKFPAVYAAVVAEAEAKERDRVGAWLAFVDVDQKAVAEGIKGKENISQTMIVDLTRKSVSKEILAGMEKESPKPVSTTEPEKKIEDPAQKSIDDFLAEARKAYETEIK